VAHKEDHLSRDAIISFTNELPKSPHALFVDVKLEDGTDIDFKKS
jgi:hypothetical protein